MKTVSRIRRLASRGLLILAALLALSSCSRRLGWGVVLWSKPESGLEAGAVVRVYIRSNIEKLFVVGKPGEKTKIELPLWQVELFKSKRAAGRRVEELGDYRFAYLIATRDGLPVRESPDNAAKRVYRLREGQSVKVIAKTQGEAVTTGGEVLAGDWFQVIADDGTRGFVFSNTMRLYDERLERPSAPAGAAKAPAKIDQLYARTWRPEYFQDMIDESFLDLDLFTPRFGLFTDAVRRQVRVELPATSQIFNYSSISEDNGSFLFEGSRLRIRFLGESRLEADWSGKSPEEKAAEAEAARLAEAAKAASPVEAKEGRDEETEISASIGKNSSAVFVTLATDIRDAIRDEEARRQQKLERFLDMGADWRLGAARESPEASTGSGQAEAQAAAASAASGGGAPGNAADSPPGTSGLPEAQARLVLSRSRRFSLTGISAMPEGYLPDDLGAMQDGTAGGELAIRLELSPALAARWEGAVSFRFDGTRAWADFLYRRADGRLELAPVSRGASRRLSRPPLLPALIWTKLD